MRRALTSLVVLLLIGLGVFWFVTRPERLPADALAGLQGDAARGETVFYAAGCASCHAAHDAEGEAKLVLAGGQRFVSPFGTFVAPNISPDPEHGIGGWSAQDLANAMLRGVSPGGAHYYPAFPYASYRMAEPQDVVDLKAFLDTLPPSSAPSLPHELGFPFNIRRTLGGWKLLFGNRPYVLEGDLSPEVARGRYLVEVLGHCAECHTPRNELGGLKLDRWLAGAPTPDNTGRYPNITPAALNWSERDIVYYLETGFTPDFNSSGGHMAAVIQNTSKLSVEDRQAIAAYLKAIPPVEDAPAPAAAN